MFFFAYTGDFRKSTCDYGLFLELLSMVDIDATHRDLIILNLYESTRAD